MKASFSLSAIFLILVGFLLLGCEEQEVPKEAVEPKAELKLTSEKIAAKNPLLPKLEVKLWESLIKNEELIKSGDPNAQKQFLELADKLTKLHPFSEDKVTAQLGGVIWNKENNSIEIPAVTTSPSNDDYLELILCNQNGRNHETLLLTECRPLHLEIMLHFAGFQKEVKPSNFRLYVAVPGKEIPVENFLKGESTKLPESLLWTFTGSPYSAENYAPDLNGDHILLWNRHEAILQSNDEKIHSGLTKILINRDAIFPNGTKVRLILKPQEIQVSNKKLHRINP